MQEMIKKIVVLEAYVLTSYDTYSHIFRNVEIEIPDDGNEWHVCGEMKEADMKGLEKILEEIKNEAYNNPETERKQCEGMLRAMDIIRKHINNGWISVEDRLPEDGERCAYDDEGTRYMKRLEIAYMTDTIEYVHGYYDGYKWMDKYHDTIKNVVAWRMHDPYRPERSEE